MPTYRVTDPTTGRTLTLTGDSPPTEAELEQIFAATRPADFRSEVVGDTSTLDAGADRIDQLLSLLPMLGGAAGGMLGGAGGTAFGMGFGGIPGAVGGAALGGGAGEALEQLIQMLRGKPVPTSGEVARDVATEGALQGAFEGAGGLVTRGAAQGARAVYRGYLKPSLAAKNLAKAPEIVDTALREALPITQGGASKANRIIGELKREVDGLVASAGGRIDLKQIADRVRTFARRRYYKPGGDLSDYNAALAVADRIDAHPALGLPPGAVPTRVDVPVAQANEAKRTLQRSVATSFGTPNASATKEAGKRGAHELRVAVEGATGGPTGQVARLNARESKLIDAARAIKHAVEREANQNRIVGVKSMMSGAIGGGAYAQGEDPLTSLAMAAVARGMMTPGFQSRAAILANRFARELGITTSSAMRLAAHLLLEEGGEQPDGTEAAGYE